MNIRQLGRVVMAQVSGIQKNTTCSKERGFESLSCQIFKYSFSSTNFGNIQIGQSNDSKSSLIIRGVFKSLLHD